VRAGGAVYVQAEVEEELFSGAYLAASAYFHAWGEDAEFGVLDDVFDDAGGLGFGVRFGEVGAGDLEAVEDKAGASGVDVVG
jgi:hypothetical protein